MGGRASQKTLTTADLRRCHLGGPFLTRPGRDRFRPHGQSRRARTSAPRAASDWCRPWQKSVRGAADQGRGIAFAVFGQGQIGLTGMLPRKAPGGLAVPSHVNNRTCRAVCPGTFVEEAISSSRSAGCTGFGRRAWRQSAYLHRPRTRRLPYLPAWARRGPHGCAAAGCARSLSNGSRHRLFF